MNRLKFGEQNIINNHYNMPESFRSRLVNSLIPSFLQVPAYYYLQRLIGTAEKEVSQLKKLVPPEKIAIDIGANKGTYAYPLSRICAGVEAFEPQPELAEMLERYRGNVRVHRAALSDKRGTLDLHIPVVNKVTLTGLATFLPVKGEQIVIKVPMMPLDDFNFTNVGFIKIDVEGYEKEVLDGARETIRREKPVLLVEIEQRLLSNPMEEIFNKIIDFGYNGQFLFEGKFQPLNEFSYEKYQKPYLSHVIKGEDALIRGKYINNFFFTLKN